CARDDGYWYFDVW
nr:immunoglobulin heavy chain junction region [Mus musculus]